MAEISFWRYRALSSKLNFASSATTSFSVVMASGLISTSEQSLFRYMLYTAVISLTACVISGPRRPRAAAMLRHW